MTIFYKLKHANNDLECYVGSTDDFKKRKGDHKSDCNNPNSPKYNLKVYRYIRSNGGFANWTFEVLQNVAGQIDKPRKLRMERELTEQYEASLNVQKAGAFIEYGNQNLYNHHHQNNTNNVCDRCGTIYRSKTNRNVHQRTAKCQRLAEQRNY